jgi:hypothetical protein
VIVQLKNKRAAEKVVVFIAEFLGLYVIGELS